MIILATVANIVQVKHILDGKL